MWTKLSQDDLLKARDSLARRQVEMATRHLEEAKALEAKHAEECKALEAKLSQLGEIERLVGAFVDEYLKTSPADVPPERIADHELQDTPADAVAPEPSGKPVEVDATKRWRERFRIA